MPKANHNKDQTFAGAAFDLSLIVPCHNEEGNIRPLYEAVRRAIPSSLSWEIIFVDDGSHDGTLAAVQQLRNTDTRVKYLSLLTNYGHQYALMTGLRACRGRYAPGGRFRAHLER